jgi:hypothetical protein
MRHMMTDNEDLGLPSDNWRPDLERSARAASLAQAAVADDRALNDLLRFYALQSNYAGSTFTHLQPNDPYQLGAADLLAVTTLSVSIRPPAIRRLLGTEMAGRISTHLEKLPLDLDLVDAEAPTKAPVMAELYLLVKRELRRDGADSSNAWVTASKICARKRPRLFPVRDSVIVAGLGLSGQYPEDWPVFAAVLRDERVTAPLRSLVAQAVKEGAEFGDETLLLKHLDALMWMRGQRLRRGR